MLSRVLEDLHSSVKDNILDPFRVTKEVERYRNYWKPDRVTTLLLAESHVHTSADDFSHTWRYTKLGGHFVRFVYCLGYGENDLFRRPPNNNDQGTWPFWQIFYSCVRQVKSNDDFAPLLKSETDWKGRVKQKIELLEHLRKNGIWLADASPVAINMLKSDAKIGIMREAWKLFTGKLVEHLANGGVRKVGIIGKTVNSAIGGDVYRLGLRVEVFDQPNFTTKERRWELFSKYYKLCH